MDEQSITKLRIIREAECRNLTGLGRTTRHVLQKKGLFPKSIRIAERANGWRETDIRKWLEERHAQLKG